jgi:hypothetical protein
MGPTDCPETLVFFCNQLPTYTAQHPRRVKATKLVIHTITAYRRVMDKNNMLIEKMQRKVKSMVPIHKQLDS